MEKKNDEILDVVERGEVKIEIKKKYDIKEEWKENEELEERKKKGKRIMLK